MWIEVVLLLTASGFCSWRCARSYFPFVRRMRGRGLRGLVLTFLAWIGFAAWLVTALGAAILVLRPPLTLSQTILLCTVYALSLIPGLAQVRRPKP